MVASKMKMLADKAAEAKRNEEEKKLYNYLMAEMEIEARSGKYEYRYDFSMPYDIQKIIEMLVNEGYRAIPYFNDILGTEYLVINWREAQ